MTGWNIWHNIILSCNVRLKAIWTTLCFLIIDNDIGNRIDIIVIIADNRSILACRK